jgi:nucleoside-diphosphate-sugar epimerase
MHAMSRRILVTGSTGNLGAYMVRLLLRDGHHVVAPVRSRTRAGLSRVLRSLHTFDDSMGQLSEAEQARLEVANADLVEPGDLAVLPLEDIDETWHFASTLKFLPRDREEILQVNIDALNHVMDLHMRCAAPDAPFYYISTVYLGKPAGQVLPETRIEYQDDLSFRNEYERSKLMAENVVLDRVEHQGLNAVVLRSPIVTGDSSFHRLVNYHGYYMALEPIAKLALHLGRGGQAGQHVRVRIEPDCAINMIPIDVLCGWMMSLRSHALPRGAVLNLANTQHVPLVEMLHVVNRVVGSSFTPCQSDVFVSQPRSKYEKMLAYAMTYTAPYAVSGFRVVNEVTQSHLGNMSYPMMGGYFNDTTR